MLGIIHYIWDHKIKCTKVAEKTQLHLEKCWNEKDKEMKLLSTTGVHARKKMYVVCYASQLADFIPPKIDKL